LSITACHEPNTGRSSTSPRMSLSAAARTSLSSPTAASPMPGTSRKSSSGAFIASAKVRKRAISALAMGLVSRRGAARNRISSSSS